MLDLQRRALLTLPAATTLGLLTLGAPSGAQAARIAPRAQSPRVGIDPLIVDAGIATRWGAGMTRDLGWAAQWVRLDSDEVLQRLEAGTVDTGIFLSHPLADQLDQQGLIHDRRTLARTDVLLVGPANDPAGIHTEHDPAQALRQVLAAQGAGAALWDAPRPGSALAALAEQLTGGLSSRGLQGAQTRRSQPNPASTPYRLTTQAAWASTRSHRADEKVWLQGGARMSLALQAARSFRSRHPGATLLMNWLKGPVGRSAFQASGSAWRVIEG